MPLFIGLLFLHTDLFGFKLQVRLLKSLLQMRCLEDGLFDLGFRPLELLARTPNYLYCLFFGIPRQGFEEGLGFTIMSKWQRLPLLGDGRSEGR